MVLASYQQQVLRLVNDQNNAFFNMSDITAYINTARGQIASTTGLLTAEVSYSIGSAVNSFGLSSLTAPSGYLNCIDVRMISITNVDTSKTVLEGRSWPWFKNFFLNGAASIATGPPARWAIFRQGSVGTVYVNPKTDNTYTLTVDSTWTPIALVDDTTVEALPYPVTDAIPYYAAYLAYLEAQKPNDAEVMYNLYQKAMVVSRIGVTPQILGVNTLGPKAFPTAMDVNASMGGQAFRPAQKGEGNV